jgi:hypothetical protein
MAQAASEKPPWKQDRSCGAVIKARLALKSMSRCLTLRFPTLTRKILKLIVNHAVAAMQLGEVDAEGAILHAAVHAWYEGHIEGEDVCPGCHFRGDMSHQRYKMINPDLN